MYMYSRRTDTEIHVVIGLYTNRISIKLVNSKLYQNISMYLKGKYIHLFVLEI